MYASAGWMLSDAPLSGSSDCRSSLSPEILRKQSGCKQRIYKKLLSKQNPIFFRIPHPPAPSPHRRYLTPRPPLRTGEGEKLIPYCHRATGVRLLRSRILPLPCLGKGAGGMGYTEYSITRLTICDLRRQGREKMKRKI